MKKKLKLIVPIVCIAVVGITFFMLYDLRNKAEEKNDNVNIVEDEGIDDNYIVEENVINDTEETTNAIEQNQVTNDTVQESTTVTTPPVASTTTDNNNYGSDTGTASSVYESDTDVGSTDRKEEAIKLVEERWGQDDTVNFRCDSVTSNGEYVVAVIDKSSADVKNYFRVNLENKSLEVDY